jgi:hypothetical protein
MTRLLNNWHAAIINGCLCPSDLEEIAWPLLSDDEIQKGLHVESGFLPENSDNGIQVYAWSFKLPKGEGLGDPR